MEPEDHELLGVLVGLEDLLHQPLFFYFRYVFSHLLIIWYVFSSEFSLSSGNMQNLLCLLVLIVKVLKCKYQNLLF